MNRHPAPLLDRCATAFANLLATTIAACIAGTATAAMLLWAILRSSGQ